MKNPLRKKEKKKVINLIDENYSQRYIDLDPSGYFLIKVSLETNELIVEHFNNNIDETGRATDPETGKVLKCTNGDPRFPIRVYKGKTAKEIGIKITEMEGPLPISKLDHALYLGRELQKAEYCLINEETYIQD